LQMDAYHKEMSDEIMDQISSRVHIHEAYRLLDNMISKRK
jgi:hypothetical protein